jgi:hypothetical protein
MKTICTILFGSHLYGTNTPTSDTDYKSVYVPEARSILLQRVQDAVQIGRKSKAEGEKNQPGDVDNEAYSVQRYLQLLAEGQTVAIDMLFANTVEMSSPLWRYIQRNSERFMTKRSAAFVGYCRTQANKYGIKGSRVAAAKYAMTMFEELQQLRSGTTKVWEVLDPTPRVIDQHTSVVLKETTGGNFETYYVCCDRMVGFKNTLKEAYGIYSRIHATYGDRARMAETNEGIDWKALSHAVRVANEALELLETHKITFPLPNAPHILDIKQGKLPYKEVAEEIEGLLTAVENASLSSTLPDEADQGFIDDLVETVYLGAVLDTSRRGRSGVVNG